MMRMRRDANCPTRVSWRKPQPPLQTALIVAAFLVAQYATHAFANQPPQFLTDAQTEIIIRLKEGPETPVGTLVYRLRGTDLDGDNLTFAIVQQPGNNVLRVENDGFQQATLYLDKQLDRETRSEYAIILTLTDGHLGEGNFIRQSLLLLVDDANDNEPIFRPYATTITVREDSDAGIIAILEATDADEGLHGQVVYHLRELDGNDSLFSISTVNGKGIVRLVGSLDYEKYVLHQLRILAVDRATNDVKKTGTAAILVKVEDVEDQPPEFVMVTPVARVSEDVPIGTALLQVKAVDGDRGINNKISYVLVGSRNTPFRIDSDSGVISTTKLLDRENASTDNGAYILRIIAEEECQVRPKPKVETELTVLITDVNDETPTFRSATYVAEINENSQANTPVTYIDSSVPQVYDYDQGNNGTFRLIIEGDSGIFQVSPHTAVNEASFLIRVKDAFKLDYERLKVINFTVMAIETVSVNPKRSSVPVTVFIRDVNDNFPEFTTFHYEVTVPENAISGTVVAKVEAIDKDSNLFGSQGIRYTAIGGSIANLLAIDPVSGLITISSNQPVFDREYLPRHYLSVEARDDLGRGNRNTAQLIINVGDVNDNVPKFLVSKYEVRLRENKLEFDSPIWVEAYDADLNGTLNSLVRFSIMDSDEPNENFTIDPSSGQLGVKNYVDFEKLSRKAGTSLSAKSRTIQLTIEARDMGMPSLASRVPVFVYVEDANDNAPYFDQDLYQATVPEDLPPNSPIIQVKAFDNDGSPPNNQIVYRIQRGAEDKFVVDAISGVIRVAHGASLDPDGTHPKSTNYSLLVVAFDGGIGEQRKNASAVVRIAIQDINNKPPVFRNFDNLRINENSPVGETVYKLEADDADNKPVLRYNIDEKNCQGRTEDGAVVKTTDYDYIGAFDLNPISGVIKLTRSLDRERVETVKMAVSVEDLAAYKGRQISTSTLTILVEDENDNSPIFRKPFYKKAISENSKSGTAIVTVLADDKDKNRSISYSLEESGYKFSDLVYVDADTGDVVVSGKIDYERMRWLNASVRATDSGYPARYSLVDVFVQIVDENDNNPCFVDSNAINVTVPENADIGFQVVTVEARDADSGDYGKITYLLDRISSQGKFRIDAETGVISVADYLDRESASSYTLIVEAWDNYQFGYSSGQSRNAFKQITVVISDVNDMAPMFQHFPVGCVAITEFHQVGEVVFLVKATDGDDPSSPNGRLQFAIEDANQIDYFDLIAIDPWSSSLITKRSLKGLHGNYSVVMRATDLGSPVMFALATLNICVTDFNDNAPRFISPAYNATIRVPENATVGTIIATIFAIDDDKGSNGQVYYALKQDLVADWKTFSINARTGQLSLNKSLNRKRQKLYRICVQAYDFGTPTALSSDLHLSVYVRKANDQQPQFALDEFAINFTEGQEASQQRWKLPDTVEEDGDADGPLIAACYYITSGNDMRYFYLDPLSHVISLQTELDREEAEMHVLTVKASNDCSSAVKYQRETNRNLDVGDNSALRVIVSVNDINDNAPLFVKRVFTGGVTTNADFGMEFMRIQATDADAGINGKIQYFIAYEPSHTFGEDLDHLKSPLFLVDSDTGSIFLNFDPQRGMKGYFDFHVYANDTGGLFDTARVLIYLLRHDQRVKFILRQNPAQLRGKLDYFRESLSNVTGAIVNVDECKVHETHDGRVDKTKCDLYLHFVNPTDNSVMDVPSVLRIVDQNIEKLDSLFKEFNVLDTEGAESERVSRASLSSDDLLWLYLSGCAVAFLFTLLLVVIMLCLWQKSSYKRQLKAAAILPPYNSSSSDLSRSTSGTGQVPNTNQHTCEGSNPMWMQAYENEWFKGDGDSLGQTSEQDSLDQNVISYQSDVNENLANHSKLINCHGSQSHNAISTARSIIENRVNSNDERYEASVNRQYASDIARTSLSIQLPTTEL